MVASPMSWLVGFAMLLHGNVTMTGAAITIYAITIYAVCDIDYFAGI